MKNIIEKLKRVLGIFLKRRILAISVFGALGVLILVFALFIQPRKKSQPPQVVEQVVNNLFIYVPNGAYAYPKEFNVEKLSSSKVRDIENRFPGLKIINGEAYNVEPKDGRDEFAFKPLKVRIYIPSDYFYGENITGVALAYIPRGHPDVYYIFPGSTMGMDEKGYYVEAEAFHTSIIMAIQVPVRREYNSLKLIREVASSVKSSVIIVPGEDPNFSGGLSSDTNFWTSVFPDRTIYVFDYPLAKVRSLRYEKDAEEFFQKSKINSYTLFEADTLANILKDPVFARNNFVIIAHGVGGLIARLALERHPEIKNVKKLVLVSTPSKGTSIANPMFFSSFLYGKSDAIISQNLGIEENMVPVIKSHVYNYLENLNVFYKDLIPGSEIQKLLSPRNDISYFVIAGTVPPMKIDVGGTELARFYPELVKGNGDGLVTLESAKISGKPFVKYDISFYGYSRADVLSAIKSFVDTEKLPEVPKFKTDNYKEFISPDLLKKLRSEAPATSVKASAKTTQKKEKEEEKFEKGFGQPEGFVLKDILRIVAKRKIPSYNSGACIDDKPYFATGGDLQTWDYVVEKGSFRFLKNVGGELTMICGSEKCRVNAIGFGKMSGSVNLGDVEDVLVENDGNVYAVISGEGGTEKLVIYTENGYRVIYEAPGTFGKLIPIKDGMIFFTDFTIAFLDKKGSLKKVITVDSIAVKGHKADIRYVWEKRGLLYILTSDHYLLVHDEKLKKSWIVGEGNIAEGFKIVELDDRYLVLLGKKVAFFVDTINRKIKGCYQVFDFEIIDGFSCDGKLYLAVKIGDSYELRIYKPVGLDLPCENW